MNYNNFKDLQQKEIDNFPFIFAFSNEQLEEGMKENNIETTKDLVSLGGGIFIAKKDIKKYKELLNKLSQSKKTFLEKEEENLLKAFIYELRNHEFIITYEYSDALDALGLEYEKLSKRQREILENAKNTVLNS